MLASITTYLKYSKVYSMEQRKILTSINSENNTYSDAIYHLDTIYQLTRKTILGSTDTQQCQKCINKILE